MKTLILFASLLISAQTFAADVTQVPAVVNPMQTTPSEDTTSDKTLLSKPEGNPCKADREKFCKDVKGGGSAMMKCMKAHEADLSASCKAKGNWMKKEFIEKRKEVNSACAKELDQFCKTVRGPKKRMDCLSSHRAELSSACQNALPANPSPK